MKQDIYFGFLSTIKENILFVIFSQQWMTVIKSAWFSNL